MILYNQMTHAYSMINNFKVMLMNEVEHSDSYDEYKKELDFWNLELTRIKEQKCLIFKILFLCLVFFKKLR